MLCVHTNFWENQFSCSKATVASTSVCVYWLVSGQFRLVSGWFCFFVGLYRKTKRSEKKLLTKCDTDIYFVNHFMFIYLWCSEEINTKELELGPPFTFLSLYFSPFFWTFYGCLYRSATQFVLLGPNQRHLSSTTISSKSYFTKQINIFFLHVEGPW